MHPALVCLSSVLLPPWLFTAMTIYFLPILRVRRRKAGEFTRRLSSLDQLRSQGNHY